MLSPGSSLQKMPKPIRPYLLSDRMYVPGHHSMRTSLAAKVKSCKRI